MKKNKYPFIQFACLFICIILCSQLTYSQEKSIHQVQGDSFTKYITFNGEQSLIAYYVPDSYDSLLPSKMILALHYCGGNGPSDAITYRNLLRNLADLINAIVVAPYCHNTGSPTYAIPDPSIITISIDSTITFLNIDTTKIYFTGGSCNGRSTFKYGLDEIYNFLGIIPFNSYIPTIPQGYYNFDSQIPSCICSGTLDPSYTNNTRLYDSLLVHNAVTYMNSIPGIGHTFNFPGFTDEMKKCIDFIDSVSANPTFSSHYKSLQNSVLIYPNPINEIMNIQIISDLSDKVIIEVLDINGKKKKILYTGILHKGSNRISININSSFAKGFNIVKISTASQMIYKKILVL